MAGERAFSLLPVFWRKPFRPEEEDELLTRGGGSSTLKTIVADYCMHGPKRPSQSRMVVQFFLLSEMRNHLYAQTLVLPCLLPLESSCLALFISLSTSLTASEILLVGAGRTREEATTEASSKATLRLLMEDSLPGEEICIRQIRRSSLYKYKIM